jgi:hypothetical protein
MFLLLQFFVMSTSKRFHSVTGSSIVAPVAPIVETIQEEGEVEDTVHDHVGVPFMESYDDDDDVLSAIADDSSVVDANPDAVVAAQEGLGDESALAPTILNLGGNDDGVDENEPSAAATTTRKRPPGQQSVCDADWKAKKILILHMDVETGGEDVGIIQLSCVIDDPFAPPGSRIVGTFDQYVKPSVPYHCWDLNMCHQVHGLTPNSTEIRNARDLVTVWNAWSTWAQQHLIRDGDKCGVIAAWNG